MGISLQGYNNKYATFFVTEGTEVGQPVTVTADNTVSKAGDGKEFVGILISKRGQTGLVQTGGFFTLTCSDATMPTHGANTFVADGNGGIKKGVGVHLIVTEVDVQNKLVGVLMG